MTAFRDTERPDTDNDFVGQLMRLAGRRAEPPADAYDRVLDAATAAWQQTVQRRRRRYVWIALAASFALVFVATLLLHIDTSPERALSVARTERVIGAVWVKSPNSDWAVLSGDPTALPAQTHVQTESGSGTGILLASGASLRLAEATDVVLLSDTKVNVIVGKVYVDTRPAGARQLSQPIEVIAPAGSVIDIGTQFEVQYRHAAYRLRVREGSVRLSRNTQSVDSTTGEQIVIDPSGRLERKQVSPRDPEWQWIHALAPAPEIEGQPLMMLLRWVSRETGRSIRFESPQIERKAQTTVMHGNVHLLEPLDALTVMLATTDLQHVLVADHTIFIKARAPAP